jgi:hypothetical protein
VLRPPNEGTKAYSLFDRWSPAFFTFVAVKVHRLGCESSSKQSPRENLLGVVTLAASGMKHQSGQFHPRNRTPLTCTGAYDRQSEMESFADALKNRVERILPIESTPEEVARHSGGARGDGEGDDGAVTGSTSAPLGC